MPRTPHKPDRQPPQPSRSIPKSYYFARSLSGSETSHPRYSRVWNPAGLKFTMNFKVLCSHYWDKHGLITYRQINLYNYLIYLGEEGKAFNNRDLAKKLTIRPNYLIADLFHLEDIELIYRVRILDLPGRPLDVVNQTPLTIPKIGSQWQRLAEQVKAGQTKRRWKALGQKFPGEGFSYKWREVMERVGNKQEAKKLDEIVLDIIFRNQGKRLDRQSFLHQLDRALIAHGVVKTKAVVASAFDLKSRYTSEGR